MNNKLLLQQNQEMHKIYIYYPPSRKLPFTWTQENIKKTTAYFFKLKFKNILNSKAFSAEITDLLTCIIVFVACY